MFRRSAQPNRYASSCPPDTPLTFTEPRMPYLVIVSMSYDWTTIEYRFHGDRYKPPLRRFTSLAHRFQADDQFRLRNLL